MNIFAKIKDAGQRVLMALVPAWLFSGLPMAVNTKRQEALDTIRERRADFQNAQRQALAAGGAQSPLDVNGVISEFTQLETDMTGAQGNRITSLTERAEDLAQLRAYLLPASEVALEGAHTLTALQELSVPAATLTALQNDVGKKLTDSSLDVARGALYQLYRDFDYWNEYLDEYFEFMRHAAYVLLLLTAVSFGWALRRLLVGDVIYGVLAAGLAGAMVSVLTKLPPLSPVGEWMKYVASIISRVAVGFAAAVVGYGFIAWGIVSIPIPAPSTPTPAQSLSIPAQPTSLRQILEHCRTPDESMVKVGVSVIPGTLGPAPTHEPGDLAKLQTACSTVNIFVLMALAVLIGFSERALPSFEEKLFPSKP